MARPSGMGRGHLKCMLSYLLLWQKEAPGPFPTDQFKRNLMDFAEGIWREFLDPYDEDSEDTPGHSNYHTSQAQRAYRLLGDRNRNTPSYTRKFEVPQEFSVEDSLPPKAPDLTMKASGGTPAVLEANDVDMQPEGELKALSPQEINGWTTRLSPSPEDWRLTRAAAGPFIPVDTSEMGRHLLNRARVTRPPPQHGSERDKGPKRLLSNRKLELLLVEPEKKKYVALPKVPRVSSGWGIVRPG